MLTATGTGFVRFGSRAVTRWKADLTADSLGYFFYLRDLESNEFWSAGYQPTCTTPAEYAFSYTVGTATIERIHSNIASRVDVCIHEKFDIDLRRITITNHGPATRTIELTSYSELALHDPVADLCHPGFSKIFIETERSESGVLLARRRPRSNVERTLSASHFLACDAMALGQIEYETDRRRFIGRGRSLRYPRSMQSAEPLSATLGSVLDPVFSLRTVLIVPPGESIRVYFSLGAGEDLNNVRNVAEQFTAIDQFEEAFTRADQRAAQRLEEVGLAWENLPMLLASTAFRIQGFDSPMVGINGSPQNDGQSSTGKSNGITAASKSEDDQEAVTRFMALQGIKTATVSRTTQQNHPTVPLDGQSPSQKHSRFSPPPSDTGEKLQFHNGYGGFSSDGREYVIHLRPGGDDNLQLPPMPWNNVICNESLGFVASETSAGNTWSNNSRLNRLTPWLNDPVTDPHSEAIYLRDHDTGEFWSVTPGPAPGGAHYEVRHGWGYSTYNHDRDGLLQDVTLFAPCSDAVKISRIQITNRGTRPRRLNFYSYAQWELGEGLNLTHLSTETQIERETGRIFATNSHRGEFSANVAFAALAGPPGKCDATCDRSEFLGLHGNTAAPRAVASGAALTGRAGVGLDPCAAIHTEFVLEPGQTVCFALLLGETDSRAASTALIEKYQDAHEVSNALAAVQNFWRDLNSAVEIQTPAAPIDLLVNGWLPYQNISCRLWGRTSAQQSGGAYGFRDQLQDTSALVFHRPDLTRAQILRNAAHQFVEGDVLHWWHPPLSKGIRTNFSDDLLWMPLLACEYVEATGDTAIWQEHIRYLTADEVPEGEPEIYLMPQEAAEGGTLYDHCCRALDRGLTRGPNGLPLMGCGDWNDGMNRVGQGGTGESVWMGFFIDSILERMLPVIDQHGDRERVEKYSAYRDQMRMALEEAGWDGGWYRRAYFDDGTPLGTASASECRIDALVQAWAVLSGAAPADRAAKALAAADEHLVDEQAGIIRLLDPPFNKMPQDPGYIKGYLPGIRENGGQYTHGVLWLIRAFAESGQGSRACKLLEMISPVSHTSTPARLDVYKSEPYVVAADVYGCAPHVGRAGWTWYTGSAGWMFRVAVESILGLRLENGTHLRVDPSISNDWPKCTIRYRPVDPTDSARKTVYKINIHNDHGREHGVKSATVDGSPVPIDERGAHVPLLRDGHTHQVVIEL